SVNPLSGNSGGTGLAAQSKSAQTPAAETVRTPAWIGAMLAIVGVLTFAYAPLFQYCLEVKWLKPEYSHAFVVPFFSAYLAYHWRDWAPKRIKWPETWGLAFVAAGIVMFIVPGKLNIAKEGLQGLSFVLNLCGATLLLGGWPALRWLWPS